MVEFEVAERSGDHVVLKIRGELTGDVVVKRLHEVLEEHYVDDGVKVIRVDMEGVTFLTLEGVAMIVDLFRESRQRGKSFEVLGLRGQPRSKLAVTGVLRLVSASEDEVPPP